MEDECCIINKNQLHLATKGKYPLHSQSIQAVYEKYLQARENARQARMIWDRKLMLALTYNDDTEAKTATGLNIVAIDPGEIHSIAAVCENNQGLIITGRKLRSIKRLRNKKLQELQKKMSQCQKHSRQWKKYRRAMNYVLSRSEAQLKDGLHKTTRLFVDWCLENNAKEVVAGDVEGVQRNTSRKKTNPPQKRRSRLQNQKMSQWQFGKLYKHPH